MDWYYSANNAQQGPVTEEQFVALARSGSIQPSTMVWRDGLPDWQPLSIVRPDLVGNGVSPAAPLGGALKDLNVQAMREGLDYTGATHALNYAGFWIRFAAKFIDGILMQVILFPINILFQLAIGTSSSSEAAAPLAMGGAVAIMGLSILVPLLYNGFMVGKYGATVGKMACGLRVVMPDGSPLTMGRSFGRYGAEIINGCTIGIGYIIAAFDDEKRSLHDHIASTRVIRIR